MGVAVFAEGSLSQQEERQRLQQEEGARQEQGWKHAKVWVSILRIVNRRYRVQALLAEPAKLGERMQRDFSGVQL